MSSLIEFALITQTAIWVIVVGAFIASKRGFIYHPLTFYLFFHGLVFVLRPWAVYYGGSTEMWTYMMFTPSDSEAVKTLLISDLALIVFSLVIYQRTLQVVPKQKTYPLRLSIPEAKAAWVVVLAFAPIAVYSAVKYAIPSQVQELGEISGSTYILTGTNGYLFDAKNLLGPLAILVLVASRFRWWSFVPLLAYLAFRVSLGSGRWALVMSLATLVLMLLSKAQNKKKAVAIGSIVLFAAFMLFAFMGAVRGYVKNNEQAHLTSQSLFKTVAGPDFANFDYLAYVVAAVPDRSHTYTYFTEVLGLFVAPIPRAIWPSKPASGQPINLVDLSKYGNFFGRTISVVGWGWMSLGWSGVMFVMVALALLLGRIYKIFMRYRSSARAQIIYFSFIPLTLQWFRDGGVVSVAKFSMWTIGPLIVWLLLCRYLSGEPVFKRSGSLKSRAGEVLRREKYT